MTKTCLDILYNKILKEVFFKKMYKTETNRLIKIIYKNLVKIVSGRSYERIRVKPLGKQYPIKKKK